MKTKYKTIPEFGCLRRKRTTTARRRYDNDEDSFVQGVNPYLVDAELKVASSKAVRRLGDKTQVVTSPDNEHIRTRITHAGEVTAISTFISEILGTNTEMARAVALGHDIGHTPFGHDGEAFINEVSGGKIFRHEIFGVVIAQHIERDGAGLNLTHEVLSAIIRDAWPEGDPRNEQLSQEAQVVAWGDRIAYLTADYNDMRRIGYPVDNELVEHMNLLGGNQRERVRSLVMALVRESAEAGTVSFSSSPVAQDFAQIRRLMYRHYPVLNASNSHEILERVYKFVKRTFPEIDPALVIALMTDRDIMFLASQPVLDYSRFAQITVAELIPLLRRKEIRWWEIDLDW
jgi:dGTP triphosphohydrolase